MHRILFIVFTLFSSATFAQERYQFKHMEAFVAFEDVDLSTGYGFDDALLGQERRDAVIDVLRYVDAVLRETGTIKIVFRQSNMKGSGLVGQAFFSTRQVGMGSYAAVPIEALRLRGQQGGAG